MLNMAPGTRANPERGEQDSGDQELYDVAQASGTLVDGSSLKEEEEGLVTLSVDDPSQESFLILRLIDGYHKLISRSRSWKALCRS